MVQPDGNVKVMDFGIARAKNSTKEQTSSVLGTAHYISPCLLYTSAYPVSSPPSRDRLPVPA